MQYGHVDLSTRGIRIETYSPRRLPVLGDFEVEPAILWQTKPGTIQPFENMLQIDAAAPISMLINRLYGQQFVSRSDEYVMIIDYHNPVNRRQQMKVGVQYTQNGVSKHEEAVFNIFECDYLFTCRQVGLDRSGAIKSFTIDEAFAYLNFQDDHPRNLLKIFLESVHLVPLADFDLELLTPKEKCVATNGPAFTTCQTASYPTRPAQGVSLMIPQNNTLSTENNKPVKGSMLVATSFKPVTFVFETEVPMAANYIFVVQYHQNEHLTFNASVTIEALGTDLYHGKVPVENCLMSIGCRAMIDSKGTHALSISQTKLKISITVPIGRGFFIEQILAIPEPNWSIKQLKLGPRDLSRDFISNCGFLIDPKTSPSFCVESAKSLVVSNTDVRQCQCAMAGTEDGEECSPYGCQCKCKENVIGLDCSRCAVGYFGWPECQKCDCVGNTICHEETGECLCPPNTADDCMSCAPDTYGYHHIAGCYECACNTQGTIDNSSSCDLKTGQCSCGPNITGRQCDRCEDGFYGFPNCKKCDCDERGTVDGTNGQCDVITGKCQCKPNVDGLNCSMCKQGTFYLAKDHPDGCITCYCSGLVSHGKNYPECSPSTYGTKWVSDMAAGKKDEFTGIVRGWSLQGMAAPDYLDHVQGYQDMLILDVAKGGGQANRGDSVIASSPKPLYWIAPKTYHGNRLGSYGGKLTYSIMWDEEKKDKVFNNGFERLNTDPDITLSGGGISIGWVSKDHSTVNSNITIEVTLMESDFYNQGTKTQISREEMLTVLKDLDDIKIKASYPVAVSEIMIQNVRLQDIDLDDQLAPGYSPEEAKPFSYSSRVEVCTCPEGHYGTSCESCKPGYFWDMSSADPNQKCKKCKCHGHCFVCDENGFPFIEERRWDETLAQEEAGQVEVYYDDVREESYKIDITYIDISDPEGSGRPVGMYQGSAAHVGNSKKRCLHNTVGNECQLCAPGYIGDATRGTPEDCQPCPCPSPYFSHAESCYYQPKSNYSFSDSSSDSEIIFVDDMAHYSDNSAAASPEEHAVIAALAHSNPDEYDIICKCAPGYDGLNCDVCADGWFGRPEMLGQKCQQCDCNGNSDPNYGTVQCDNEDGTCTACAFGTAGKHCEICDTFKYGNALEKDCSDCPCYECGSEMCHGETGDCVCKSNVIGDFCDQCAPGFWDYDACHETGCKDCGCDPIGSIGPECNQTTGVCECQYGVDGDKCDACAPSFWDLTETGCKKCECPPGTPCDAETGKCFCQEGLVGDRCDQCADNRAVPMKQTDGKTECQPCTQCIDWLLGPDEESGVWFNEKDASQAIQPLTYRVQEVHTTLKSTKASQYSRRRFEGLQKGAVDTAIFINKNDNKNKEAAAGYMTALASFNNTHHDLYEKCYDVHELFDLTNSTDKMGNETLNDLDFHNHAARELVRLTYERFELIKQGQKEESATYAQRKENITATIEQLEATFESLQEVSAKSNVMSELEAARELSQRVADIYDTKLYESEIEKYEAVITYTNSRLDDLKEKIDHSKITTSNADDTLKSLETAKTTLEADITRLTKVLFDALDDIQSGVTVNDESNQKISDAQAKMDDIEDGQYDDVFSKDTELALQERIRLMNGVIEVAQENATKAETHSAAIQKLFETLNEDFPDLESKVKQIKEYNVSSIMKNTYDSYIEAQNHVINVKEVFETRAFMEANNTKLETCSNDLRLKNNELETVKAELNKKISDQKDIYQAILTDLDELDAAATTAEFHDNTAEIPEESLNKVNQLYQDVSSHSKKLEQNKAYVDGYQQNLDLTDKSLDDVADHNRHIQSQFDMLRDSLHSENEESTIASLDRLSEETEETFQEIDDLLLGIREEIERTQTLVNEVSKTVKVEYDNQLTRHDARTLPSGIDMSVSTVLEFNFRLNASTSELITIHDKANVQSGEKFDIRARDGRLELTVKLDENTETKIISDTVVFDENWAYDKWFHARASRYGRSAILEVRPIQGSNADAEVKEAELNTERLQWLVTDPEIIVGGELAKCAIIDIELNDRLINQWMWSDHSPGFTNEDLVFDIDEVSKQYHSDDEKSTCGTDGGCFTFTGENSWAHITAKHHSKFLINKRTGTIMLQMKLFGPLQSDGLIFFIGDPEQTKYFMAMDIKDAKPRFIYNLDYAKGAQVITLDSSKSLYQEHLNIRIGMVGGVAGLAVQEWRDSKVKPIENDRMLKENCPTCDFKISNEMHFGGIKVLGRNLSHLDEYLSTWNTPYRGCMRLPVINHKTLDLLSPQIAKSNIYQGCQKEEVSKLSFDGTAAVRRTEGLGQLNNVK